MPVIKLHGKHGEGKHALVSPEDHEALNRLLWRATPRGYVYASLGGGKIARMHSLIARPPEGFVADHINGDPMDNRRENLRVVTVSDNHRNIGAHRNSTSKYVGVHLQSGKWEATASQGNRQVRIGRYSTEEEAARARDAFVKANGLLGRLNFPEPPAPTPFPPVEVPTPRACPRLGGAKLQPDQVREIRRRYREGGTSQRALAREYGVAQRTISSLVTLSTWTDVA